MSNKVIVQTTSENKQIYQVNKKPDYLGGENSKYPPNSNRYVQRKENLNFKRMENELTDDIKKWLIDNGHKLISLKVYHSSSSLVRNSLQVARYNEANGLTLLVLEIEGHPKLFTFSVCSKNDMFCRLDGRVYAKLKMKDALDTKGLGGLYVYPVPEQYRAVSTNKSVTPSKIGNWIIKTFIHRNKKVKNLEVVNSLVFKNEDSLLEEAKTTLIDTYNLVPESLTLHTQYIRKYRNDMFKGLNATLEWYSQLTDESKQLISNGGYTVYGITGINQETKAKEIYITFSRCSDEEAFQKSLGRKQCLINFAKNKVQPFSITKDVPDIKGSLVAVAQQILQIAINIDIKSLSQTLPELPNV